MHRKRARCLARHIDARQPFAAAEGREPAKMRAGLLFPLARVIAPGPGDPLSSRERYGCSRYISTSEPSDARPRLRPPHQPNSPSCVRLQAANAPLPGAERASALLLHATALDV